MADHEEELLDYEEDEAQEQEQAAAQKAGQEKKGYVGIHASGFKDFMLKDELIRAITDCGFEHPSEGEPRSPFRRSRSAFLHHVACTAFAAPTSCPPATWIAPRRALARVLPCLACVAQHRSSACVAFSCLRHLFRLAHTPHRAVALRSTSLPAVQHECIPQAVLSHDILCQAKSGMGKTAVFVLSILQQIEAEADAKEAKIKAIVLCHTRELAFQITKEFDRFAKFILALKDKIMPVYGGVPITNDIKRLKENPPYIIVGTPGRVKDLAERKHINLSNVRHFVLDECDKMLEKLDMRADLQAIFKMTPHDKQVMMFSATLGQDVRPICKKFMSDVRTAARCAAA